MSTIIPAARSSIRSPTASTVPTVSRSTPPLHSRRRTHMLDAFKMARNLAVVTLALAAAGCAGGATTPGASGALPAGVPRGVPHPAHRGGGWLSPAAKSAKHLIYVADFLNNDIEIYPTTGSNPSPIGQMTDGISGPEGCYVDRHGNLFVTNVSNASVTMYPHGSTTYKLLYTGFVYPTNVVVGRNGMVYVVDLVGGKVVESQSGKPRSKQQTTSTSRTTPARTAAARATSTSIRRDRRPRKTSDFRSFGRRVMQSMEAATSWSPIRDPAAGTPPSTSSRRVRRRRRRRSIRACKILSGSPSTSRSNTCTSPILQSTRCSSTTILRVRWSSRLPTACAPLTASRSIRKAVNSPKPQALPTFGGFRPVSTPPIGRWPRRRRGASR